MVNFLSQDYQFLIKGIINHSFLFRPKVKPVFVCHLFMRQGKGKRGQIWKTEIHLNSPPTECRTGYVVPYWC